MTCALVITCITRLQGIDTWFVGTNILRLSVVVLHSSVDGILVLDTHNFLVRALIHQIIKLAARLLCRRNVATVNSFNTCHFILLVFSEHLAETLGLCVLLPKTLLQRQGSGQVSLRLVVLAGTLGFGDGHVVVTILLTQVIQVLVGGGNFSQVSLARNSLISDLLNAFRN